MALKQLVLPSVFAAVTAITATAVVAPLVAQQPAGAPAAATYNPPRTPWGDPDLQGIWPSSDMVNVPLERPEKFGTRLQLTDAEFKQLQATLANERDLALKDFDPNKLSEVEALGDFGDATSPPPHWLEKSGISRQTSLIVQPANGRLPKFTP